MARVRLRADSYFTIPYSVFEILLQMRGAIDPDSGQIVCQFLDIGVAVLETQQGAVPIVVLDHCAMATFGKENVDLLLSDAAEVDTLRVKPGGLVFDDVEVDNYWGPLAVAYAAEAGAGIKAYKLRLDVDGRETSIAALLIEQTDAGPMLLMVPRSCEAVEEETSEGPLTHL